MVRHVTANIHQDHEHCPGRRGVEERQHSERASADRPRAHLQLVTRGRNGKRFFFKRTVPFTTACHDMLYTSPKVYGRVAMLQGVGIDLMFLPRTRESDYRERVDADATSAHG